MPIKLITICRKETKLDSENGVNPLLIRNNNKNSNNKKEK